VGKRTELSQAIFPVSIPILTANGNLAHAFVTQMRQRIPVTYKVQFFITQNLVSGFAQIGVPSC
jgi:hypothetical protein